MINIAAILFYLFSGVMLGSAMMVVTTRNTVHGVLFLILSFFNAAGLFIIANAEFLALLLVVVYVGAVAVLFLFVVMMLNIDIRNLQRTVREYSIIAVLVGGTLAVELVFMLYYWKSSREALELIAAPMQKNDITNTQALGNLLYTHYALIFQASGLILLIAMVGAIVLTLRHREGVKRQKVKDQLSRDPKESLSLVDISSGSGI